MADEHGTRHGLVVVDRSQDRPAILDQALQGVETRISEMPVSDVPRKIAREPFGEALKGEGDALDEEREEASRLCFDRV